MGKAYERIRAGLEEAIAFASGEDNGSIVHTPEDILRRNKALTEDDHHRLMSALFASSEFLGWIQPEEELDQNDVQPFFPPPV